MRQKAGTSHADRDHWEEDRQDLVTNFNIVKKDHVFSQD